MHWIVIYPVDSVIQPTNNQGLHCSMISQLPGELSSLLNNQLLIKHVHVFLNSCQDSEGQNVYALTDNSNKDPLAKSSEEPEDPKETTPLTPALDEPLETKPTV